MTLSLKNLKTLLALVGINNLSVKFEPENRLILAVFYRNGEKCKEIIPFDQVEGLFTDTQEATQDVQSSKNLRPNDS